MSNDSQDFLARCLLFDIETNENGEIYASGASFNGKRFNTRQGEKVAGDNWQSWTILVVMLSTLAVSRQAMTITINPEAKGKTCAKANFEPLETHYSEKNFEASK